MSEPLQPDIECKFGYDINNCNKIYCLKGPDEECNEDGGGGRLLVGCAENLGCCGFCHGCTNDIENKRNCSLGTCRHSRKRTSSKPLWFPDNYQRQEEKKRLQRIQYHQSEDRQRERFTLPRDLFNMMMKSEVERLPMDYNFEYSAINEA